MSRIIDNQHHASDVIGGMLLGTLIAIMYILRAMPRYARVLSPGGGSTKSSALAHQSLHAELALA